MNYASAIFYIGAIISNESQLSFILMIIPEEKERNKKINFLSNIEMLLLIFTPILITFHI